LHEIITLNNTLDWVLLVPLYYKAVYRPTAKLVEKNKKIRLASAKKTIEELEKDNLNNAG
jgi:hypothetical protein